ncbi:anti-sigma factor family protein [Hoeflea prorocentri]|uniref:Anti-sigma factor n=1 Tax=Hoeflea prorocentri TaxID=1922333 RepID=A0A9X3ZHW9_9HYPH|nr:anti-sigma factor [Hoeflea prorocentri]MCY6381195.1 anti-sigma factor [Hoeflea prorocentri]MDA5398995.1 anti-sigma factor [Hoeflea prorocentri]
MTEQRFSDEELMAFADGQLDPDKQAAVERAIDADEEVAARVAALMESGTMAKDGLKPLLDEPVPASLTAAVESMVNQQSNVTAFPGRARATPPMRQRWALPLAASIALVAGAIGGYFVGSPSQNTTGGLKMADLAQPGIVTALNSVASGAESALSDGERFRAIASYRGADGALCREFEVDHADDTTVVGVACRPSETWTLQFTVVAGENASGYAPASSLEALDAYLTAVGAGQPLSVEDEARLLEAIR